MILFYRLIVHGMSLLLMYVTDEHTIASTISINCDYRLKYDMAHYLFVALKFSQGYFFLLWSYLVLMMMKGCTKTHKQSKVLSFTT